MKELEDYTWFPKRLRDFQTEYIGFVVAKFNIYDSFIQHLQKSKVEKNTMIDLCSGSGEPAISIYKKSKSFNKLILTDKFPNKINLKDSEIEYLKDSIDVLTMEFKKDITYTMFNAFHHFSDEDKIKIVKKIKENKSQAYFVEILEPHFLFYLKVLSLTIFGTLFFTPFIKPFSILRILLTYFFPINLLTISYDGIVSVMKSKSEKQYKRLFENGNENVNVFKLKKNLSSLIVIHIQPSL